MNKVHEVIAHLSDDEFRKLVTTPFLPKTIDEELLMTGPVILDHAEHCSVCTDRLTRLMSSLQELTPEQKAGLEKATKKVSEAFKNLLKNQ